jgi:phosphatidylglycerol:prolipoprotein diacylglycerol transferase
MHPTLFHFFGLQITTYGAMVALAFVALWIGTVTRGKKLGYPEDFLLNLLTVVVLSAFISARALHVAVNWSLYSQNPKLILFSRDGYVFLGGFVGAVLACIWYIRKHNQSILGVADLFAPFLALAHGIGRIGCFLFGCCYGKVCSEKAGVHFPPDSPAFIDQINQGLLDVHAEHSLAVYPTQLFSSVFNLINFAILLFLLTRQKFKGQIAMCYLMIYGTGRFIIEFFRGDYRGALGPLSTSQLISLLLISAGLAGYLYLRQVALPPDTVPAPDSAKREK